MGHLGTYTSCRCTHAYAHEHHTHAHAHARTRTRTRTHSGIVADIAVIRQMFSSGKVLVDGPYHAPIMHAVDFFARKPVKHPCLHH